MREIEGDPAETSVDEHYENGGLDLVVVRGSFVAPAPAGYEGADHLEYEQGDRLPQHLVTLAEFSRATNLSLVNDHGKAMYGAGFDGLSHSEVQQIGEYGVGGGKGNFHPEEHTVESDGENAEAGDARRNADGTFGEAEG